MTGGVQAEFFTLLPLMPAVVEKYGTSVPVRVGAGVFDRQSAGVSPIPPSIVLVATRPVALPVCTAPFPRADCVVCRRSLVFIYSE